MRNKLFKIFISLQKKGPKRQMVRILIIISILAYCVSHLIEIYGIYSYNKSWNHKYVSYVCDSKQGFFQWRLMVYKGPSKYDVNMKLGILEPHPLLHVSICQHSPSSSPSQWWCQRSQIFIYFVSANCAHNANQVWFFKWNFKAIFEYCALNSHWEGY